jgi:hypothetical protein
MRGMRGLGLFLFGAGAGAIAGVSAGRPAMPFAIGAAVVGLILAVAGSVWRTGDLIGDASAPDRPALAGLGTRVEQILRIAEEQADDHRAEARREADAIIAAAHAEARRIHPG